MGKGLAAIVCAVALVAGAMAWADTAWVRVTARCPDQPVVVTAQDVHVIGPVCKASAAARQQFEACHLTLKRPVNIIVVQEMPPEHGNCYGIYECKDEQITVLHPGAIAAMPDRGNAFRRLDATRLFQSLIVHELTHAAFAQTTDNLTLGHAAAEYMAYAMQLSYLEPDERQLVLSAHPVADPVTEDGLNDMILFSAPSYFAAKSWRHFSYTENGCDVFQRLVDDEVVFPPVAP